MTCQKCGTKIDIRDHPYCHACNLKRLQNVGRCCEKATHLSCVCNRAWKCPEHGKTHIGIHA